MNINDRGGMDPVLAEALDELRSEPIPEPEWDEFKASIVSRATQDAEPDIGARRYRLPRGMISLAAAAGIATVLWILPQWESPLPVAQSTPDAGAEIVDEGVFVRALGEDVTEAEFRLMVTGRANPEAMLAVAVGRR